MTGIYKMKQDGQEFYPLLHADAVVNMKGFIQENMIPWMGVAHINKLSDDDAKNAKDLTPLPIGEIVATGYKGLTRDIPFIRNDDGTLTFTRECVLWYQAQLIAHPMTSGKHYIYLTQYINDTQEDRNAGRGSNTMNWQQIIIGGNVHSFKEGDKFQYKVGTNITDGFHSLGLGTCYFMELFEMPRS